MSSVFHFKDQRSNELISGLVYNFQCDQFNETYYGELVRHLGIRSSEHIGLSFLIDKKAKPKESSIKDYLLLCNHTPSLDDFSVLAQKDMKFCLEIKERFLIKRDQPHQKMFTTYFVRYDRF